MTLSLISLFVKKYGWVFGVIIAVLILFTLVFLRFFGPAPTPPAPAIERPNIQSQNIKTGGFETQDLSLPQESPKELAVYGRNTENLLARANQISQKLGFPDKPTRVQDINKGEGLVFSNDKGSLGVYPNEISYNRYPQGVAGENFKDPHTLKSDATNFISSLGLASDFSEDFSVDYFKKVDEFTKKSPKGQDADILTLALNYSKNGVEIINPNSKITATFDKTNNLISLIYFENIVGQAQNTYPIITGKEALALLQSGKGALIETQTEDNYTPQSPNIDRVILKSAQIAYYLDSSSSIVQPAWVFYGIANTQQGEIKTYYAVPAINQQFLK